MTPDVERVARLSEIARDFGEVRAVVSPGWVTARPHDLALRAVLIGSGPLPSGAKLFGATPHTGTIVPEDLMGGFRTDVQLARVWSTLAHRAGQPALWTDQGPTHGAAGSVKSCTENSGNSCTRVTLGHAPCKEASPVARKVRQRRKSR